LPSDNLRNRLRRETNFIIVTEVIFRLRMNYYLLAHTQSNNHGNTPTRKSLIVILHKELRTTRESSNTVIPGRQTSVSRNSSHIRQSNPGCPHNQLGNRTFFFTPFEAVTLPARRRFALLIPRTNGYRHWHSLPWLPAIGPPFYISHSLIYPRSEALFQKNMMILNK
jgi:hypothetical protein